MEPLSISFIISAFIAGVLMFLAPCTLPLVPAFLAFISGTKQKDVLTHTSLQKKIVINTLAFSFGFSVVFILFGILAGFFGAQLGVYRDVLTKLGGLFITVLGLMMLHIVTVAPLKREIKFNIPSVLTPGTSVSAFVAGTVFAFGWTPCVGPILASILLLASTATTALTGGLLLGIFSLGLSLPFLLTAVMYTKVSQYIERYVWISKSIDVVGGVFLVIVGVLLFTDHFSLLVEYGYTFFRLTGADILFKLF